MDALVCELVIFDLPSILVCYFHERQLARANVNLYLSGRPTKSFLTTSAPFALLSRSVTVPPNPYRCDVRVLTDQSRQRWFTG